MIENIATCAYLKAMLEGHFLELLLQLVIIAIGSSALQQLASISISIVGAHVLGTQLITHVHI